MNMNDISLSLMSWTSVVFAHNHTVFWYLHTLIFYILLTPILYVILKNRKFPIGTIVWIVFLLMCSNIIPVSWTSWGGGFFPKRLYTIGYFMTGAYIAINHKEVVLLRSKALSILGIFAMIGCVIAMQFVEFKGILLIIFCISTWCGSNLFTFDKEIKWYMKTSFFIYCLHSAILEAIEKVFLIVGGNSSAVWALLDYICAPIITIFLILVIAKFMQRYMPKVWGILNGGRGI